jgi:hypothetical protein
MQRIDNRPNALRVNNHLTPRVRQAMHYLYNKYLQFEYQPQYRPEKWDTLKCGDNILHRPNNGLRHSTYIALYLPMLIQFFKTYVSQENAPELYKEILWAEKNLEEFIIAALFSVAGRKDETGFSTKLLPGETDAHRPKKIYRGYRIASAEAYLKFMDNTSEKTRDFAVMIREMGNTAWLTGTPVTDPDISKIFPHPQERPPHLVDTLLHLAHCLDLIRCLPAKELNTPSPFDILDRYARDFKPGYQEAWKEILKCVQRLITLSGDRLQSFINENGEIQRVNRPKYSNINTFYKVSTDPDALAAILENAHYPDFNPPVLLNQNQVMNPIINPAINQAINQPKHHVTVSVGYVTATHRSMTDMLAYQANKIKTDGLVTSTSLKVVTDNQDTLAVKVYSPVYYEYEVFNEKESIVHGYIWENEKNNRADVHDAPLISASDMESTELTAEEKKRHKGANFSLHKYHKHTPSKKRSKPKTRDEITNQMCRDLDELRNRIIARDTGSNPAFQYSEIQTNIQTNQHQRISRIVFNTNSEDKLSRFPFNYLFQEGKGKVQHYHPTEKDYYLFNLFQAVLAQYHFFNANVNHDKVRIPVYKRKADERNNAYVQVEECTQQEIMQGLEELAACVNNHDGFINQLSSHSHQNNNLRELVKQDLALLPKLISFAKTAEKTHTSPVTVINQIGVFASNPPNRNFILLAAVDAIRNYRQWYKSEKKHRGENGFFTWARHGKNGQKFATEFRNSLCDPNTNEAVDDIQAIINNFLDNPNTHFNNHSLASFLLDELSQLDNSPWADAATRYPAYRLGVLCL